MRKKSTVSLKLLIRWLLQNQQSYLHCYLICDYI